MNMLKNIASKFKVNSLNNVRQHDVLRLMKHVQDLNQQVLIQKVQIMQLRRLVDVEYVETNLDTAKTFEATETTTEAH